MIIQQIFNNTKFTSIIIYLVIHRHERKGGTGPADTAHKHVFYAVLSPNRYTAPPLHGT